jgi:hypothetical protein
MPTAGVRRGDGGEQLSSLTFGLLVTMPRPHVSDHVEPRAQRLDVVGPQQTGTGLNDETAYWHRARVTSTGTSPDSGR